MTKDQKKGHFKLIVPKSFTAYLSVFSPNAEKYGPE